MNDAPLIAALLLFNLALALPVNAFPSYVLDTAVAVVVVSLFVIVCVLHILFAFVLFVTAATVAFTL